MPHLQWELVQAGWNARGRRVQPNRRPMRRLLLADEAATAFAPGRRGSNFGFANPIFMESGIQYRVVNRCAPREHPS